MGRRRSSRPEGANPDIYDTIDMLQRGKLYPMERCWLEAQTPLPPVIAQSDDFGRLMVGRKFMRAFNAFISETGVDPALFSNMSRITIHANESRQFSVGGLEVEYRPQFAQVDVRGSRRVPQWWPGRATRNPTFDDVDEEVREDFREWCWTYAFADAQAEILRRCLSAIGSNAQTWGGVFVAWPFLENLLPTEAADARKKYRRPPPYPKQLVGNVWMQAEVKAYAEYVYTSMQMAYQKDFTARTFAPIITTAVKANTPG